jgi:hypothetical protein
MNIGFDLDKIFIDYPPFVPAKIFDKLYKKRDNGILLYRFPSYPEQLFRKATHYHLFRPPIKENILFLKNISKQQNKLYLISSRFGFLQKETNAIMKRYQLDKIFDGVYFNFENKQPHLFKTEILTKLHLDMYIDDDLSLLNYLSNHTTDKTKFFWLNYAREKKPLAKNVFAISQLSEIFK